MAIMADALLRGQPRPIAGATNFATNGVIRRVPTPTQFDENAVLPQGNGIARLPNTPTNAPPSTDENTIYAPQRTTIQNAMDLVRRSNVLPNFTPVNYTPANMREVGGVTNPLNDNYFDLIEKQAAKKMQDRYFNNPDSLSRQFQNQMNKRGLIGSGIEVGGTNQFYKTYGDELVDLQSNLAQQRYKAAQDTAFKNKEIELSNANAFNQASMQNAAQKLAADQKNREFQGFLSELGLKAAADESKTATDFDTRMFEQQVALGKSDQDSRVKFLSELNTSLNNTNIDPETRNILKTIFTKDVGNYFGANIPMAQDQQMKAANLDQTRARIREIDNQLSQRPSFGEFRSRLEQERAQLLNELLGI